MSVRVLSSAMLLLALAVAGAVVLAGARQTETTMPRVAPAVDTAGGQSTAPAPDSYTSDTTYVPAPEPQESSHSSSPMEQPGAVDASPEMSAPASQMGSPAGGAAPGQAPASQPGPGVAPSRFLDPDPDSPAAQLVPPGPTGFKMKPGVER